MQILPKLHEDLSGKNLETLADFHVNYSFVPTEPDTAVEKHFLGRFCLKAAEDLATQRGREYGFGSNQDKASRATFLQSIDPTTLTYLPTNNLDCERDLAVFDKLARRSAACSNKKFTGKLYEMT